MKRKFTCTKNIFQQTLFASTVPERIVLQFELSQKDNTTLHALMFARPKHVYEALNHFKLAFIILILATKDSPFELSTTLIII